MDWLYLPGMTLLGVLGFEFSASTVFSSEIPEGGVEPEGVSAGHCVGKVNALHDLSPSQPC